MPARHLFCTLLLLILAFSAAPAAAEKRVALVIGNGAYANATHLINPPNDAADMAVALRSLGFEVIAATNVDKVTFDKKVREFAGALNHAHTALFFYAGHGMQVAGKNYAVPVDAKLDNAADLQVETVDIDRIMEVMQSDDTRVNLVFLDACRDNPLTRSFARALPATRALSVGSGLTAVDAGRGTLIAFSTAPNKVALDGQGRNSPFTGALLKYIGTPGLDIALILRRVTADVEAASGGTQVPWVHASLTTDVILKPGIGPATPAAPPAAATGPGADELAWSLLKDTKDADQLKRFVEEFPQSARKTEAETRIASLGQPGAAPEQNAAPVDVAPPNEPLPADISIEPEVLRTVETDPFFANAPPVRAGAYNIVSSYHASGSGALDSTGEDTTSLQWLRRGILKETQTAEASVTNSAGSMHSTTQTTAVSGGNGFLWLGSKAVTRNRFGRTPVTNKVLRIDHLSGHLFPVQVGNKYSYDIESRYDTVAGGTHYSDVSTMKYSCEITKKYEAKRFHVNLTGSAYLAKCRFQTTYRKNKAGNSTNQNNSVFFDRLGLWLSADPVYPREQIILNGAVSTTGTYTSMINGSYTLQSFSLAR